MATTLTATGIIQQRWGESWIVGSDAADFWPQLQQFQTQLQDYHYQNLILVEPDPIQFLAAFLAACQQPGRVWLANPQWGLREWQQVAEQCAPDLVVGAMSSAMVDAWGDRPISQPTHTNFTKIEMALDCPTPRTGMAMPCPPPDPNPPNDRPQTQILIPTGGSSGNLRFAVHTWETLSASVQGFQQHFHSSVINAYCVLPLFHVSGLMQAMRCLLSGGQLILQPFRTLLQEGAIASPSDNLFLSLVPTQLQRLLNSDRDFCPWLRQFTAILLGGAPPWPSLLNTARDLQLSLAPTYGMTETASQVATLLPVEFLAGNTSSGRALPHANITIRDNTGQRLPPNQTGHIAIESKSLARGYSERQKAEGRRQKAMYSAYSARDVELSQMSQLKQRSLYHQTPLTQPFQSGDLGFLDEAGYLYVLGREKTLIMTGGEKVLPEEVEAAILAAALVQDVAVIGVPDEDWGEVVVAVVVPVETRHVAPQLTQNTKTPHVTRWISDRLIQPLKSQLSPYKIPKHWLVRASLPRNPQGKLNRMSLHAWVEQQLQQRSPTAPATQLAPGQVDSAAE